MAKLHTREELPKVLRDKGFWFNEFDSRMNYGAIGTLWQRKEMQVLIFPTNFYVRTFDFPVNTDNLKLIQSIQKEFKELTRNKKGKIITFKN